MAAKEKSSGKTATEKFGEMFRAFGDAMSKIFDDPKLKEKANEDIFWRGGAPLWPLTFLGGSLLI